MTEGSPVAIVVQERVMNSLGYLGGLPEEVTCRQDFEGWIGVAGTKQEHERDSQKKVQYSLSSTFTLGFSPGSLTASS